MSSVLKIITFVILLVCGIYYFPLLTPSHIEAFMEHNSALAPIIFILICTLKPLMFFIPSFGLTIVAGVMFGAVMGTVYVAIGGALSTVTGYFFARWMGREAVMKISGLSSSVALLDSWAREKGSSAVLLMRLFNLPWDIVSYWAGLSGVGFREFYLMSLIPLVPVSFLYTYFGSHVFYPGSPEFIISLVLIIILSSLPFVGRRLRRRADV